MGEFLTPAELRELTDRAHRDAQAKVLEAEGIPFRWIGGQLKVSRHHVREWLAGNAVAPSREPAFANIR